MTQRTKDLAAARRLLLGLSEGLITVSGLLTAGGLAAEGRAAARMGTEVVAMRRRVRTAHNALITDEAGDAATTEGETR